MLGDGATAADIGALRHQYELDLPLHTHTALLDRVLHGDLGSSIRLHATVFNLIRARYHTRWR